MLDMTITGRDELKQVEREQPETSISLRPTLIFATRPPVVVVVPSHWDASIVLLIVSTWTSSMVVPMVWMVKKVGTKRRMR